MATIIGIVSGVLTIYAFGASFFPGRSSNAANVRVASALDDSSGSHGTDGTLQMIRLYNENQEVLGSTNGGYIGRGAHRDFQVGQVVNQQAAFGTLYATSDALCIPYVTITRTDGTKLAWTGEWGRACGLEWYYGGVEVDGKYPDCTWIDADHTNGIKASAITIRFPSFASSLGSGSAYCRSPHFRAYRGNDGSGPLLGRRTTATQAKRSVDTRLVVSARAGHNVTELCQSETSRGPDFLSLPDMMFCDMETREISKVCHEGEEGDCISMAWDTNHKLDKRDGREKAYTDVIRWE